MEYETMDANDTGTVAPSSPPADHVEGVAHYLPNGLAVFEDGLDAADLWAAPGISETFKADEEAQESDNRISEQEKEAMADGREPFNLFQIYLKVDGEYGPCWIMDIVNAAGQNRTLILSAHEQRDGTMKQLEAATQQLPEDKGIKNLMLKKAWQSKQGSWFYVIRPWNQGI